MEIAKANALIEEFQCPGCLFGSGVDCGKYKIVNDGGCAYCDEHVLGTLITPIGVIALGLPKGFNRPGFNDGLPSKVKMRIRLWENGARPDWDHLNLAVWAMEKDGYLFVRTYMPRINWSAVDVIKGGTLDLVPHALDVGVFLDEID